MTSARPANDTRLPDAAAGNWVDRVAPAAWRPYLRLARIDRPIGWWLLLLPCWWSSALAGVADRSGFPALSQLLLFLVGAIVMRGAGSAYNDLLDRDLDRKVERTRGRPLASGLLTARQAIALAFALSLAGLMVLLSLNAFAIALGFASLVPVAIYPVMKRVTAWPQAVLGLAFAWGALMGWAAHFGSLAPAPIWLYVAAVAWTVGYDTVYAIQDVEDDAIVGIGSTARYFGDRAAAAVAVFYAVAVLSAFVAFWLAAAGPAAYVGLAGFAAMLARQAWRIDLSNGSGALALFRSNREAGLVLFAGLALDAALQGA